MATVFKPQGKGTYSAQIKVWDASKGKLVWKKVATGAKTEDAAMGVALTLEKASGEARAGTMSKSRAEALLESILTLAGVDYKIASVSLRKFGDDFLKVRESNVEPVTSIKYNQQWKDFKEWAKEKADRGVNQWTGVELGQYYQHLAESVSTATANDHFRLLNMVFLAAIRNGHAAANPVKLVERKRGDQSERAPITAEDHKKTIKLMLKRGREDWRILAEFGWNTGHRIQDLLSLTAEANLIDLDGIGPCIKFQPSKKKGRGGKTVTLPIPSSLAKDFRALGSFKSIHGADNDNGKASVDFVSWMSRAGVDTLPVKKKKRIINLKTFHSYRHSMVTRLANAGVSPEVARMVTDHDSIKVQRGYMHAEVKALAEALKKVQ